MLGRYREALADAVEALGLYRSLAARNPAYQHRLADVLVNLGSHLGELDRNQEALAADEEALGLWRSLAESNPAYQPRLAMTLHNLANHLSVLGAPPGSHRRRPGGTRALRGAGQQRS